MIKFQFNQQEYRVNSISPKLNKTLIFILKLRTGVKCTIAVNIYYNRWQNTYHLNAEVDWFVID